MFGCRTWHHIFVLAQFISKVAAFRIWLFNQSMETQHLDVENHISKSVLFCHEQWIEIYTSGKNFNKLFALSPCTKYRSLVLITNLYWIRMPCLPIWLGLSHWGACFRDVLHPIKVWIIHSGVLLETHPSVLALQRKTLGIVHRSSRFGIRNTFLRSILLRILRSP